MRVHHFDCCSMCPFPERLVKKGGSLVRRGFMPAHCLLIETPSSGLVLVDTGIGLEDRDRPVSRLGLGFTLVTAPKRARALAAIERVKALGHDPRDVRHIVPTHLDVDHAGGLPDFPWAKVHVHAAERDAAQRPPTFAESQRYRRAHFAHGPDFAPYESTGEPWKGFSAVRDLPGLPPEILAIPMPGHTRGHSCIAVSSGGRWLVHAGDAYFGHGVLDGTGPPKGLAMFERVAAVDYARVQKNHERLRELATGHRDDVDVFCAHDAQELDALLRRARGTSDEDTPRAVA